MKYDVHYCVNDLETGGFHAINNGILEVAIIMLNQKLEEVERYETYVLPYKGIDGKELEITPGALQANGINMDDVYDTGKEAKVVFKEVEALVKKYKCGRYAPPIMVGHNMSAFDTKFWEYFFNLHKAPTKTQTSSLYSSFSDHKIDTMHTSRQIYGLDDVVSHQLGDTCEREGISLIDAHRAMNDTESTAKLFKTQMLRLRSQDGATIAKEKEYERSFKFPI